MLSLFPAPPRRHQYERRLALAERKSRRRHDRVVTGHPHLFLSPHLGPDDRQRFLPFSYVIRALLFGVVYDRCRRRAASVVLVGAGFCSLTQNKFFVVIVGAIHS